MAYKKKDKNRIVKTKRTASTELNDGKFERLAAVDLDAKRLKNEMSLYVFVLRSMLFDDDLKKDYKFFESEYLNEWEKQNTFHMVIADMQKNAKQFYDKQEFFVQHGAKPPVLYKRNCKGKKKGDVKKYEIKTTKTRLTVFVSYLLYVDLNKPNLKLNEWAQTELDNYKKQPEKWARIIKLISQIKSRAIKHPPVYTTGTHVVRMLGKTEYQFHNENKKYKHWFKYKGVSMPLMIEKKSHRESKIKRGKEPYIDFSNLNLGKDKQVLIQVNHDKRTVNLFMNQDCEAPKFIDLNRKFIGLDLNVKHNFVSNSKYTKDYDRVRFNALLDRLQWFEKIGFQKLTHAQKLDLQKLFRAFENLIQETISVVVNELFELGYTDIVLEHLDNSFNASIVSNEEFDIKYTQLTKLLHLGNIKKWFLEQAEKKGMRVHTTNPAFTSQECTKCHCIESENRPSQEVFHCIECGYKANADEKSGDIIGERITNLQIRDKLHVADRWERFSPRPMKRSVLKGIILSSLYHPPIAAPVNTFA